MRMRSKLNAPPGGWQFIDAPISHEPVLEWGFEYLVGQVIQRRRANPRFGLSLDPVEVGIEVEEQNALRISKIPNAASYLVEGSVGVPQPGFPMAQRSGPLSAAARAKQVSAGIGVLTAWLGSGGEPVGKELSEVRAVTCAKCPQNNRIKSVFDYFTEAAAGLIKKQLEIRRDLNLSTPHDSQLGTCEACTCPLKLKVHVPIDFVLKGTDEATKSRLELGQNCWVLAEEKALQGKANG